MRNGRQGDRLGGSGPAVPPRRLRPCRVQGVQPSPCGSSATVSTRRGNSTIVKKVPFALVHHLAEAAERRAVIIQRAPTTNAIACSPPRSRLLLLKSVCWLLGMIANFPRISKKKTGEKRSPARPSPNRTTRGGISKAMRNPPFAPEENKAGVRFIFGGVIHGTPVLGR